MSLHKYDYPDAGIRVTAGWDRPLGYLFLVVENEKSTPIYDNISDPRASNAQDTEHYKEVLRTLSIPVPEGFWLALEDDKVNNKGNETTRWTLDYTV